MSFQSIRKNVNKEELSFLTKKESECDHITLSAEKHNEIMNILAKLPEIHVDPFLKEGIIVIEENSFDENLFTKRLKENCSDLNLKKSIVDELLAGVDLLNPDAIKKILKNYSEELFQKDLYGDIEDLADIAVTLLRNADYKKTVFWFEAQPEENIYNIHLKVYYSNREVVAQVGHSHVDYNERSENTFLYDISFSIPAVVDTDFRIHASALDLTAATLLKMGKSSKAELHMQELVRSSEINNLFFYANTFMQISGYINHLQLHPELKQHSTRAVKGHSRSLSGEKTINRDVDDHTVKNIELNGIRFATTNTSIVRKLRSHKVQRLTNCWDVHGHYRHYKNGKVVYIAPYEKGPERNTGKKEKKNYNL